MELSTGMLFPFDVSDASFGKAYFDAVTSKAPTLTPIRCGNTEPLTQVFSDKPLDEILAEYWEDMFLWKSSRSKTAGIWSMGAGKRHSSLFIYGAVKSLDPRPFIELYKTLAKPFAPVDFGYVHLLTDAEWNACRANAREVLSPFNSGIGTAHLSRCIPNLPWGAVFGSAYISLIGLDRLLSAPAPVVERWAEDLIYVQVTENINDLVSSYEDFDIKRNAIKAHLGDNLFFRPGSSSGQMVAPEFNLAVR
jgi:hypothetical protein